MKFGIRAALQALLEADDQIGGKTLGESALTLVRRHRAAQESARTMCNGLEAARAQLAEAHQSEARALAELDKVRAQFRGLGFEFDDLLKERDALAAARDALEHQLATVVADYNAAQLALSDLRTPPIGSAVPWTALEDGALYADSKGGGMLASFGGRYQWLWDARSRDLDRLLKGEGFPRDDETGADGPHAILIARNLGGHPEPWRDVMQQYLVHKGTK